MLHSHFPSATRPLTHLPTHWARRIPIRPPPRPHLSPHPIPHQHLPLPLGVHATASHSSATRSIPEPQRRWSPAASGFFRPIYVLAPCAPSSPSPRGRNEPNPQADGKGSRTLEASAGGGEEASPAKAGEMKLNAKTLKGTSFEIEAPADASVAEVKQIIESSQGRNVYPAEQLMLIYKGKILKDDTTLESNEVAENSFVVIMLSKPKASSSGSSAAKTPAPVASAQPATPAAPVASAARTAPSQAPVAVPEPAPPSAQPPAPAATATPATTVTASDADVYSQAASNLVSGNNLEQIIQQILDMGGGTWDRDTVVRALRAAYNNPERAIDYLYSGIPENVEVPPVARAPTSGTQTNPQAPPQAQTAAAAAPAPAPAVQPNAASAGPNVNPLNLFPQGIPSGGANPAAAAGAGAGALDALRQLPQFQALLALVQANPQILQPMLQELGKQNPQVLRLIQENQAEFLRLVNESPESGTGGNILGQLAAAMPQTLTVTPEEREAIQRLEAMGFNRELVLEVFFACNKDEELAANYLLDHGHEFEEQQQQ